MDAWARAGRPGAEPFRYAPAPTANASSPWRVGESLDLHISVTFSEIGHLLAEPRDNSRLRFFRCLGRQSMLN